MFLRGWSRSQSYACSVIIKSFQSFFPNRGIYSYKKYIVRYIRESCSVKSLNSHLIGTNKSFSVTIEKVSRQGVCLLDWWDVCNNSRMLPHGADSHCPLWVVSIIYQVHWSRLRNTSTPQPSVTQQDPSLIPKISQNINKLLNSFLEFQ